MFQNLVIAIFLFLPSIIMSQVDKDSTCIYGNDINGKKVGGILDGVYLQLKTNEEKIFYDDFDSNIYNRNFILKHSGEYQLQALFDSIHKQYGEGQPAKIKKALYINPISILSENPSSKIFFNDFIEKKQEKLILPNSIYSIIDTAHLKNEKFTTKLVLDSTFSFPFKAYLTPYYIKKTEVTNKEYREFIEWVKDSISRELIYEKLENDNEALEYLEYEDKYTHEGEEALEWVEFDPSDRFYNREVFSLNWYKEIDYQNEEIRKIIDEYFYPQKELRFYKRKEIDTRKLKFRYYWIDDGIQNSSIYHSNENKQRRIIDEVINIYPDTSVWVRDFFHLLNNPMTNMYFWHPAYDNYPVVGLNYKQIQAFLHWKSMMLQKELNRKNNSYKVTCKLPNEVQWDMLSTMKKEKRNLLIYPEEYTYTSDDSWITDLLLFQSFSIDTLVDITENQENRKIVYRDSWDYLNPSTSSSVKLKDGITPKYLFNVTSDESDFAQLNQDNNGIAFMGGNVSEWVDCEYKQWKSILDYRHKLLDADSIPSAKFIMNNEKYFDTLFNNENGIMVRGSNWYDHRFLSYNGKNINGMNAKRFVDPNKSFATVGFRYVIYVEPLD
jgi:formylglycine-generating enzyme required for sulfatase activity